MSQDQLRQAFALMKQGDKRQAAQIVQDVIKQERDNVSAWWLLANVLDDPIRKQKALERVLLLDANHPRAQQMLASLKNGAVEFAALPNQPDAPAKSSNMEGTFTQEIEVDWSKLEQREAKKKAEPSEESSDNAIKIATYLMIIFPIVIAIGLGVFMGIPAYRNSQTAAEVKVVMTDFLIAMMAGDFETAETFVCLRHRSDGEEYFAIDVDEVYEDYSADISELEITVSDFAENAATAYLTGDVSLIPTEGEQQLTSIDAIMGEDGFAYETTSFRFALEDGQWRICDRSFRSG